MATGNNLTRLAMHDIAIQGDANMYIRPVLRWIVVSVLLCAVGCWSHPTRPLTTYQLNDVKALRVSYQLLRRDIERYGKLKIQDENHFLDEYFFNFMPPHSAMWNYSIEHVPIDRIGFGEQLPETVLVRIDATGNPGSYTMLLGSTGKAYVAPGKNTSATIGQPLDLEEVKLFDVYDLNDRTLHVPN